MREQFRDIKDGEVPVVVTHNYTDRAVFGDLVTNYAVIYWGAEAVVVDGRTLDVPRPRPERSRVWCRGFTPLGAVNSPVPPLPEEGADSWRSSSTGVVVCDDAGVLVIPHPTPLTRICIAVSHIEAQEDVWFFFLDTLKWDTKTIVCDKAYLDPEYHDRIPRELCEQLTDFQLGSA